VFLDFVKSAGTAFVLAVCGLGACVFIGAAIGVVTATGIWTMVWLLGHWA
jgi:hypothetical protein